ncbi:hypothetical protein N0V85_006918 [Neurospora sp. IMI 360204]|nr:hypothetical protein N0V85_006918 [Neurospora sp. IMI 360204]
MDSQSVSPFLRLPVELRLEIYKHVWTVPEAEYVYRPKANDDDDSKLRLSVDYLTAQLSAIRKLGAISQRIRAEAYPEYFDHMQIMLRYDEAWFDDRMVADGGPGWDERNRRALYILSRSYLLQTQARHVYLHWPARGKETSVSMFMRARQQEGLLNEQWALECVSLFENLRSLDVHVDNGLNYWFQHVVEFDHPDPDDDYDYKKQPKRLFYDDERRAKLIEALKTHYRKLEKAVVRRDISHPEDVKEMNEHKAFKWWRRLKRDVAVLASHGPSSVGIHGMVSEHTNDCPAEDANGGR